MKCTITGGYFTWLRAESVLQNTEKQNVRDVRDVSFVPSGPRM